MSPASYLLQSIGQGFFNGKERRARDLKWWKFVVFAFVIHNRMKTYLWSRGKISTIVYFTHLRVIFWKKISRKVRQGWAIFKSPYSLYLQVISQMHFQIIIFFILVSAAGISCVERKMQANICQTMHQYLGNLPLKKKYCTNIKILIRGWCLAW